MNETDAGRRYPAHPPVRQTLAAPVIVFLTVCTVANKPILARCDVAALLVSGWQKTESWAVGRYVIMPDHVHLFCAPSEFPARPLEQWVRFWKAATSRAWPRRQEQPVWQRDGWDTQLRRDENYEAKWEYEIKPDEVSMVRPEGRPAAVKLVGKLVAVTA